MEDDRAETLEPILEPCPPIGVPEELRIAQPRSDHALGVARDRTLVGRRRVDDREERFLEAAVLVGDGEEVLMMDQRGDQHFVR